LRNFSKPLIIAAALLAPYGSSAQSFNEKYYASQVIDFNNVFPAGSEIAGLVRSIAQKAMVARVPDCNVARCSYSTKYAFSHLPDQDSLDVMVTDSNKNRRLDAGDTVLISYGRLIGEWNERGERLRDRWSTEFTFKVNGVEVDKIYKMPLFKVFWYLRDLEKIYAIEEAAQILHDALVSAGYKQFRAVLDGIKALEGRL